MPITRSELREYEQSEIWPMYRTVLGLFFDNPDTFYREDEVLSYVDRPREIVRMQLWIVRLTGATEEFPVEVKTIDGETVYGLQDPTGGRRLHRTAESRAESRAESTDEELREIVGELAATIERVD